MTILQISFMQHIWGRERWGNLKSLWVWVWSTPLAKGLDNVDESAVVLHATLCTSNLLLLLFLGIHLKNKKEKKNCSKYIMHSLMWTTNTDWRTHLKVLGKSVGLCKTSKWKDQLYISLRVSVWRIICENFNPNEVILAEIWMKI